MTTANPVRMWGAIAGLTAAMTIGLVTDAQAQSRELWLYDGEATLVEGYFLDGEAIFGWCDQDCYDLDLFLYDIDGNLITGDDALDAEPIVYAPYSGYFYVELTMPNCSHPEGCAVWVDSTEGF
ncbi:hypothetical protein XM38_029690 [Halomicronema hongdechloris C2206]|uniref:Uncharacterized protein n=1 Tax=Halomicronema hongdechloris C2206 TaxID=1641165 RepID=A0A1Z3HNZ4_9CYAN|nr:hypothetical protein [Halomicronema hongdechloris]ASC72015.1 hypothetical protein XM38_029690 [Halomicronema hongdechloris C2206]